MRLMTLTVMAAVISLGVIGCKDESGGSAAVQSDVQMAAADAAPVNKICPISGHDVESDGQKVVYKGKVYGFCCDDCVDKFKADPAKSLAKLQQQSVDHSDRAH